MSFYRLWYLISPLNKGVKCVLGVLGTFTSWFDTIGDPRFGKGEFLLDFIRLLLPPNLPSQLCLINLKDTNLKEFICVKHMLFDKYILKS